MKILVTGATGYVGGRLIPKLLQLGFEVRILARNPDRIKNRSWYSDVEIFTGDVLNKDSLKGLFTNIDTAFYLIHSLSQGNNFNHADIEAAENFSQVAQAEKLNKIIYLGGLAEGSDHLSEHLLSRQKTGEILRNSDIDITEFRSGVIVGSGSLSFEIIRNLTERLPIMICPKWVYTKTQPISIENVLEYLIHSVSTDTPKNSIFEIGGDNVLSYGDMIRRYALIRGLSRLLIPVPVLTPKLSSYWIHWTTPVSAKMTRPLVEGLKNESIVHDKKAQQYFPQISLINYDDAVKLALSNLDDQDIETSWSDSLSSSNGQDDPIESISLQNDNIVDYNEISGMLQDKKIITIEKSSASIFTFLSTLGGETGWLYGNLLWKIRGYIDLFFGGVGLRRGRRDPMVLNQGDALDFWRIEKIIENKLIRLKAEMKVPGKAWLQYDIVENKNNCTLTQTAFFAPKGLLGLLYWYSLFPIHIFIFKGMIKAIKNRVLKQY
tara:strand:+ start:614 stop:2089 length:1476 start_codon:yes stop_codon:yes gene_type:complete